MPPAAPAHPSGVTLRSAALIAGFGLLAMVLTAPIAELVVLPDLVVHGDPGQTVENLSGSRGLFLAAIFCYLTTFTADVVVAWALYVLLAPVNRSLSLLTAWFRLVYTIIALFGLLKLVTTYRLLASPAGTGATAPDALPARVDLLVRSFGYEWGFGFVFFSIHLLLLGILVYRSGYVPKILGALLIIAGLGYGADCLKPYLYPGADLGPLMITFFGELVFMLWLLIRGWKLEQPPAPA